MTWGISGTKSTVGAHGSWTGDLAQFLDEPTTLADAKAAVAAAEALADAAVAAGITTYPVSMCANGHRSPDGGGQFSASVFWSAPAPETIAVSPSDLAGVLSEPAAPEPAAPDPTPQP